MRNSTPLWFMERDITTFENASKALCQSERTRLIARAAPRLAQNEEPGRTGGEAARRRRIGGRGGGAGSSAMLKFHQEETCEGIIQHLEAREGKTRRDVCERDKGPHMASPNARVEMTFLLDEQLYALEHTGVEPFDGFMELQNTADQRVEPFRAEVTSKLSALFDTEVMLVMGLPA